MAESKSNDGLYRTNFISICIWLNFLWLMYTIHGFSIGIKFTPHRNLRKTTTPRHCRTKRSTSSALLPTISHKRPAASIPGDHRQKCCQQFIASKIWPKDTKNDGYWQLISSINGSFRDICGNVWFFKVRDFSCSLLWTNLVLFPRYLQSFLRWSEHIQLEMNASNGNDVSNPNTVSMGSPPTQ